MCLGMPGKVVEIVDIAQERVKVDVVGVQREISAAMIGLDGPDAVQVGDWVIVHSGLALSKMDEDEAIEILGGLRALDDLYEQELRDHASASNVAQL